MTASVSFVSLILVVFNARQPDWLWRTQTENANVKRTNTGTAARFPTSNTDIEFFLSLDYARGNESFIYFTDLCKPIETYIYARKMPPFASDPAAKHPNAANLGLQTYDKNQRT